MRKEFSGIIQEDIFLTEVLETLGISSGLSFHINILPTYDERNFFFTTSMIIIFSFMHVEIIVLVKNKLLLSWSFPYVVFEHIYVQKPFSSLMVTDSIMYFNSLFLIAGVTYKFDNSGQSWVVRHEDTAAYNEELDNTDIENKDDNVIKQDMSSGTYGYEGDNHTYTAPTDGTGISWGRDMYLGFPKVKIPVSWTS